jgi:ligand-binding sensor domain-containing protein
MTSYYRYNRIYSLLLVLTVFTSCNGQVKTDMQRDGNGGHKAILEGKPKMSHMFVQDKAGNLWLCNSRNEGVTVYDGKSFAHYREKDGLSSNFVWTILEDSSGKLWFGTADGITCFDGKKFTTIPITAITGSVSSEKTRPDMYGMPKPFENSVFTILQDRKGIFWFGTTSGIYRYDGKMFSHFLQNDGVIDNSGVRVNSHSAFGVESILEDKSGNIWFGGRGSEGVFRFDGKVLSNFKPNGDNWVRPIFEDKTGTIWFATCKAILYRYNGSAFTEFGKNEFNDWVYSMEEDSAGNFWFSNSWANSKKGGVVFYNSSSEEFTHHTIEGERSDASLCWVLIDKSGTIWFSNGRGLCRYNGKAFAKVLE